MKLNNEKLHDDLMKHNLTNYKTTNEMCDKMEINRSSIYNLKNGCDIRSSILIKIITELNVNLKDYLK